MTTPHRVACTDTKQNRTTRSDTKHWKSIRASLRTETSWNQFQNKLYPLKTSSELKVRTTSAGFRFIRIRPSNTEVCASVDEITRRTESGWSFKKLYTPIGQNSQLSSERPHGAVTQNLLTGLWRVLALITWKSPVSVRVSKCTCRITSSL